VQPIFYHIHDVSFYRNRRVNFTTNYKLSNDMLTAFYWPYAAAVSSVYKELVAGLSKELAEKTLTREPWNLKHLLKQILWTTRGTNNVFKHMNHE
jgi:hypothetical protein